MESMSIDKLLQELSKVNKLSGFSLKKLETGEDGAWLLDPSNPYH